MCVSPFLPRLLFTIINIQPLPNGLLPKTHKANCCMHTNLYIFFLPFNPECRPPRISAVNAGLYNDDSLRYLMDTRTRRLLTSMVDMRGEHMTYELQVCTYMQLFMHWISMRWLPLFLGYHLSDYNQSKTLALGRDHKGQVMFSLLMLF